MAKIIVVENPRRRTRRRMTAKQRKYFGPRRRKTTRRRRRNPLLATLGNPRRRRRARTQYVRGYRRRRNTTGFFPVSMTDLAGLTAGAVGSKIVPGLIRNFVPTLPTGPMIDLGIKVGSGYLMSIFAGMVGGAKLRTNVFTGALVAIAVDLWNQYGAPMTGLGDYGSGYMNDYDMAMVTGQPQIGEYFAESGDAASAQMSVGVGEYTTRTVQPLTDWAY